MQVSMVKKNHNVYLYSVAGWRGTGGAAALGGTGGRGSGTEGVLRPQAGNAAQGVQNTTKLARCTMRVRVVTG